MIKLSKQTGALTVSIIVASVVVAGLAVYLQPKQETPQQGGTSILTDAEMENLAKQRFKENLGYSPSFVEEIDEPLIKGLFLKHKLFVLYGAVWLGCPPQVIGVNRYDGRTFLFPNEFDNMIKVEEISLDESVALDLSKAYVKLWYYHGATYDFGEPTFLESADNIPWSENAKGTNPSEYENVIEPPQVTRLEDNYQVNFYTWSKSWGAIWKWVFQVKSDQVLVQMELIALKVGDYERPAFIF